MSHWDEATALTVLCCVPAAAQAPIAPLLAELVAADTVHEVGPRPGREIDALLVGRVLVIGDDADLAAVVVRLIRKELLGAVEVAYAAVGPSVVAQRWSLPVGPRGIRLARLGDPDLTPLVRDDAGGVLIGEASLGPILGTVYLDEHKLVAGGCRALVIEPHAPQGLRVTVLYKKFGLIGRRPVIREGRAIQIGTVAAQLVADGWSRDRLVERWTYYAHTSPLRLIRGAFD